MKILLIINPKAGMKTFEPSTDEIVKSFADGDNIELVTEYTEKEKNATTIIKEHNLDDIDLVVLCGGDGTLNEGVNGMMTKKKKVPISFIPLGTINDLARTIEMPTDKFELSKTLKENREMRIKNVDVGRVNDKYFCYVAAFGSFTDVSYSTPQEAKNRFGKVAYYFNVIKELFKMKSYEVTTTVDNGKPFTEDVICGVVCNTIYMGGVKFFKREDIALDDGMLDVLLMKKPKHIWGYFNILKCLIKKKYKGEKNFYRNRAKKVKFEFKEELPWTIDGEYAGTFDTLEINVVDNGVSFAIPKR